MPFCEDTNDSTVARVIVDSLHNVANILPGLKEAEGFAKLDLLVNSFSSSKRYPYRQNSNGVEGKVMEPVKHLNHLARLRKTAQFVEQCFYRFVDRPFHVVEDTVQIQTAHLFLSLFVALYVSLGEHIWFRARQAPA